MSEKDKDDLRWALRMRVDMIALSFVRSAEDIVDVHTIMDEEGIRLPVIAKIEKPQAVDNLEDIVRAFDGLMVARGDLGVEMPLEEVPLVQKRACELARRQAKPVIVATQVLESMIENSRPTRAEASDAANAVLDGADALMLSGETSVGKHPFAAVRTMARIIENTEDHGLHRIPPLGSRPHTKGGAVTAAAAEIGELLGCTYLITFTMSGDSSRRLSRVRPRIPMLAFTPSQWTRSQLALTWGVETFLVQDAKHTDEMAMQVDEVLLAAGRVQSRATSSSSSPARPPASPGRRTRCASTASATPRTGWLPRTASSPPERPPDRPGRVGMLTTRPGRGGGMADTEDSKSSAREGVRVQVPLPAHE